MSKPKTLVITITVEELPIKDGQFLNKTKWDYRFENCTPLELQGMYLMAEKVARRERKKMVKQAIKENE